MKRFTFLSPVFYLLSLLIFTGIFYLLRTFMTNIDERDHIVIGFLMQNGKQVYSDIFTNHFPFPYYWTNLFAYIWAHQPFYRAISIFRIELLVFYLISFSAVLFALKSSSTRVAFSIWIILTGIVFSLYHGNLVLSETFAAICVASIFWLTVPVTLKFEKLDKLKLFLVITFAAVGFWTQPFLIVLFAVPFFLVSKKDLLFVLLCEGFFILAPVIYFFFTGQLGAFFSQTILFNFQVYSKMFPEQTSDRSMFIQNIGDFFNNEISLFTSLNGPLEIYQFFAHLSIFILLFLIIRTKNLRGLILFFVLFGATRVRDIKVFPGELFNFGIYPLILFSSACAVLLIISGQKYFRITGIIISGILLITSAMSAAPIFSQSFDPSYNYQVFWSDREEIGKIINGLTKPDERILVYPHDVDLYFFAGREPIDNFTYWFPWINSVPQYRNQRLRALEQTPPALIYVKGLAYKDDPNLYERFFPNMLEDYQQASSEGKEANIWIRKDHILRLDK